MNDDLRAELRLLRARAFGPGADIGQDPAALRRLRELERLANARRSTPPVDDAPVADPDPALARVPAPTPQAHAAAVPAPAAPTPTAQMPAFTRPGPADVGRGKRRQRPRPIPLWPLLIWVATVVVAAGWSGGATYGLAKIAPVAVSHGAPQIATLRPTSAIDLPSGWFGAGPSSATYEFYGLVLFETGGGGFGTSGGTDCFSVVAAEDLPDPDEDATSWSISNMYSGCRVGAFPATVSLIANSNAPEELRARYPDGALQFVRDGDRIGVFLDAD